MIVIQSWCIQGSTDSSDYLQLLSSFDGAITQLPNTISISFKNIKSNELIDLIKVRVACSAGSACHCATAGLKMSDVLEAMHVDPDYGLGASDK